MCSVNDKINTFETHHGNCEYVVDELLKHFEKELNIISIKAGTKILLAVSGGVDSIVMLDMFNSIKEKYNLQIGVASFNHKLRKEADGEIIFVENICLKLNIPFYTSSADVKSFSKENGLSIEEGARILRYKFLKEIAEKYDYNYIATAHNANDLLETVLLRLTKGTGPFGLASMKVLSGIFLKPLLPFKRSEIEEYASCKNLKYVVDNSNFDIKYNRNFLRHEVVPKLKYLNPSVEDAVLRLSSNLCELDSFIESILDIHIKQKNHTFDLGNYLIFKLPDEELLQVELIRRYSQSFFGKPIDYEKLERFKRTVRSGRTSFKISFWGERGIEISRGWCIMGNIKNYPTFTKEIILNKSIKSGESIGKCEETFQVNGYFIKISRCDIMNKMSDKMKSNISSKTDSDRDNDKEKIFLKIKNWSEGDRTIEGKKVKEIFDKKRVPTFVRHLIPLVVLPSGEVIYIPYLHKSEQYFEKFNIVIETKGGFYFES
ncbi:MAG: tRNA lysidine(34) synthetase TilS [Fervidobacterium sp.]